MTENFWVSPNGVMVVAEVGLNHNGDLDRAKELIDVAAEAGADAVKFQKRDVASLAIQSVLDSPDPRFPGLGSTYRELREKHEFSLGEFRTLQARAHDKGLSFFVTPFDVVSLEFLDALSVDRFKIASHSVSNIPLLEEVARRGKPCLLSTGMAEQHEVDRAVRILGREPRNLAILHCVSAYPTPPSQARLDLIGFYEARYGLPVGYSGHEIGFQPTLYAVAAGAKIVERHITMDNNLEGFDHGLSLNPEDFVLMVEKIRSLQEMFRGGPKSISDEEWITRKKYQVSMVARRKIFRGEVLSVDMIEYKNPGTGIPPAEEHTIIGLRAASDIDEDSILERGFFDE